LLILTHWIIRIFIIVLFQCTPPKIDISGDSGDSGDSGETQLYQHFSLMFVTIMLLNKLLLQVGFTTITTITSVTTFSFHHWKWGSTFS